MGRCKLRQVKSETTLTSQPQAPGYFHNGKRLARTRRTEYRQTERGFRVFLLQVFLNGIADTAYPFNLSPVGALPGTNFFNGYIRQSALGTIGDNFTGTFDHGPVALLVTNIQADIPAAQEFVFQYGPAAPVAKVGGYVLIINKNSQVPDEIRVTGVFPDQVGLTPFVVGPGQYGIGKLQVLVLLITYHFIACQVQQPG